MTVGVTTGAVYIVRRREPDFAAAWEEALALGYTMLETLLVGQALAGDEGADISTGALPQVGSLSVDLALRLLTAHRNASGKPNRPGPKRQFATPDDSDTALITRLAQIEARRAQRALEGKGAASGTSGKGAARKSSTGKGSAGASKSA